MTDSIINFLYSDDVPVVSIFIRSDMPYEKVLECMNDYLSQLGRRHINWDYMVAFLIKRFAERYHPTYHGVKICRFVPHGDKGPTINITSIKPIEEKFKVSSTPLIECFHVKVTDGVGLGNVYYDAPLNEWFDKLD